MIARLVRFVASIRSSIQGIAMVELAMGLVVFVPLFVGGIELANYVSIKMRVSQIALHVVDNASRIGIDSLIASPRITETQINDLFLGAKLQGGSLNLQSNGRVILSSVEADPSRPGKNMIRWQRCYGGLAASSSYGAAGATNLTDVGPTGRKVSAISGTGVMFVEIKYNYVPLFLQGIVATPAIQDTAAMMVRDDRDYTGNSGTGIYNAEGATPSSC